jgi:small GTP-binding protein
MNDNYDYIFKILAVGDENVGKTSLIEYFINDFTLQSDIKQTLGVDIRTKFIKSNDGKNIKLLLFDSSGNETFKKITTCYFRYCNGIFVFYDVNKLETFYNAVDWIKIIKKSDNFNGSIILVGNRNDRTSNRQISYEEAIDIADKFNTGYVETSIFENKNINSLFSKIINLIRTSNHKIDENVKIKGKDRDCCVLCNIL